MKKGDLVKHVRLESLGVGIVLATSVEWENDTLVFWTAAPYQGPSLELLPELEILSEDR